MNQPRLFIRTLTDAQGDPLERPIEHGDFADGPKGRQAANATLDDQRRQMEMIAAFNREHQGKFGPFIIERRFVDGVQELTRIPHHTDFQPKTLAEAREESAAFVAWYEKRSRLSSTEAGRLGEFQHRGFACPERGEVTADEMAAILRVDRERDGWQLIRAASCGDVANASALIDAGVDVNVVDDQGSRPLHRAANGGHTEVAALLLKHGADATARDNYKHSVHMGELAVRVKSFVKSIGFPGSNLASDPGFMLLEKERLAAPLTEEGRTPLMVAEQKGREETAAMLRAHALAAAIDAQPISAKPEPSRQWPEPFAGPDEPGSARSQVTRAWPKPFTGPDDTSPTVRAPAEQRAVRRRL